MPDQDQNPVFDRVAVCGLGLIGSSLARAIRAAGAAGTLVGTDGNEAVRERSRELGLCDVITDELGEAVKEADLVILCVPVGAMTELAKEMASSLKAGAMISDVGSVKDHVTKGLAEHLPDTVHLIPAHPIAGTEHSGPDAGFAELFENRWSILTPAVDAPAEAVERLRQLWERCGAKVDEMTPEHHDLVLAVTSHVPHLIAYTMVGVADDMERVTEREVINYSAAGFRDFTRIAASDPTMWRDVFLTNRRATLEILGRFTEELFALQRAIRTDDGEALHQYFTRTRAIRRGILEAGQDVDVPDFGRRSAKPKTEE